MSPHILANLSFNFIALDGRSPGLQGDPETKVTEVVLDPKN